jgi:hypothetical protein
MDGDGIAVSHVARRKRGDSMFVFPIVIFLSVGMLPTLIIARLVLCIIRLLNETWFDEEWQVRRRTPAEHAALLDWEASIRDFHRRQSALCFPPEAEKSEGRKQDTGILAHGPSAFQERRRLF